MKPPLPNDIDRLATGESFTTTDLTASCAEYEKRYGPLTEEEGVCMNCGDPMDLSPMHPWCPKCDEEEE